MDAAGSDRWTRGYGCCEWRAGRVLRCVPAMAPFDVGANNTPAWLLCQIADCAGISIPRASEYNEGIFSLTCRVYQEGSASEPVYGHAYAR